MTVGNIATDGYGLNVTEKPNVPVNGYGSGVPTGLFAGSVKGDPVADEIIEGFFDELLLLDSELETVAALIETVEVTELVGVPMAQSLMVGVSAEAVVVGGETQEVALEELLGTSATLDSSGGASEVLSGTETLPGGGEQLELEIITFAQLPTVWGNVTGLEQVAQTIKTSAPFYRMTSVEIVMRQDFGTPTDDVTLDIHEWHSVGIPPLPDPPDGPLVASITVTAADIPTDWGIVRFKLATPLFVDHTEYALVLRRATLSDTDYYGIYVNQFANYSDGEAWGKDSGGWSTGGAVDLPLKIYGLDVGGGELITGSEAETTMMGDDDTETGVV